MASVSQNLNYTGEIDTDNDQFNHSVPSAYETKMFEMDPKTGQPIHRRPAGTAESQPAFQPDPALMPDGASNVVDVTEQQQSTGNSEMDPASPMALTGLEFNRFVEEIQWQPDWRTEADKSADYYDNNQFDQDTLAELERRGIMPIIKNLIQPTIDIVLGMEAKTRTDWRVTADSERWADVAEGLSQKLHEAEREGHADRAVAQAYAGQVKTGVGWVEAVRHHDPFEYKYNINGLHRREIYWDWPSVKPNLSDARYLIRRRWFDIDQAMAFWPQARELIYQAGNGWPADWWLRRGIEDANHGFAFDQEIRTSLEEWEWRNVVERRIVIFEVWYRRFVRGYVMDLPNGETVEVNMSNKLHEYLLGTGKVKPRPAVYSKLRRSFWVGPYRIADRGTERRHLPYVPFWGYREDLTGIPYGLIRTMISPQDEINARAQKMLWLLSAKRVFMDSDALDKQYNTFSEVLQEIGRADAAVILNPDRKALSRGGDGFEISDNLQLADAQFKVMQENKEDITRVRGIFNAMMGNEQGAESGVAIDSLIEQSTTVLAEINDNHKHARIQVGELMLGMITQDNSGQPVEILVDGPAARKKTIILNEPTIDPETGLKEVKNEVSRSRTKVGLMDVPSTPAYRKQLQVMLAEVMKGLPDNVQAILTPFYLESTDLPYRREAAELVRKQMNIQDESAMSDEQLQAMQKQKQMMQELEMRMNLAQIGEQEAKVGKLAAEKERILAEAKLKMKELAEEGGDGEGQAEQAKAIDATMDALNQTINDLKLKLTNKAKEIEAKIATALATESIKADANIEIAEINSHNEEELQKIMGEIADLRTQVGGIGKSEGKDK